MFNILCLSLCISIFVDGQTLNGSGTLIGSSTWEDDFKYSSIPAGRDSSWFLERFSFETYQLNILPETIYTWAPDDGHPNITFWGPFNDNYIYGADFIIERTFRCAAFATAVTITYKTAACAYHSDAPNHMYLEFPNGYVVLMVVDNIRDGDDGKVDGSDVNGYSLDNNFGTKNGANLNDVCQDLTDGSQRYWVQEWAATYTPNDTNCCDPTIFKDEDFIVTIRSGVRDADNYVMVFDITVECHMLPTESPSIQPTINPSNYPSASPTYLPSIHPTQSPTQCIDFYPFYNSSDGEDEIRTAYSEKQINYTQYYGMYNNQSVNWNIATYDNRISFYDERIDCNNNDDTDICFIGCYYPGSCVNLVIEPIEDLHQLQIICGAKKSCNNMEVTIDIGKMYT